MLVLIGVCVINPMADRPTKRGCLRLRLSPLLFNVLSGYTIEAFKSVLPILLVITIASLVMWFKQRRHMKAY